MTGWAAVFAAVTVVDVHAGVTGKPTLSCAFRCATRKHPVAVTVFTAYLLAHLYGAIPARFDPLAQLARGTK